MNLVGAEWVTPWDICYPVLNFLHILTMLLTREKRKRSGQGCLHHIHLITLVSYQFLYSSFSSPWMACVLPSLFPKLFPWTSCQKAYKMCFSTLELWGIQIRQVPTQSFSLLEFSFALLTSCFPWLPLYWLVLHFWLYHTFNIESWNFRLKVVARGREENANIQITNSTRKSIINNSISQI